MRYLTILVLAAAACQAQTAESEVAATVQKMERAEQTGDFNTWLSLWTPQKATEMQRLASVASARPERQYRVSKIYAQGDAAVVLAQAVPDSFAILSLRKEGGRWRISDLAWREKAADPNSVYALVPPPDGAFSRAGSPWDQIAPAMPPTTAAQLGWQMRSVFDESFLYIRIETGSTLPAPGSTIDKPPSGWPVMKISVAGTGDFVLLDSVNVGDQATFDSNGKANSHRAFASYEVWLERNDHEIFTVFAGPDPSPLVQVSGPNLELRVPLRSMGISDSRTARITVGDAQWPKSVLASAEAVRFPR